MHLLLAEVFDCHYSPLQFFVQKKMGAEGNTERKLRMLPITGLLVLLLLAWTLALPNTFNEKCEKQREIPQTQPFPCELGPTSPVARSSSPPTSVHQLRPGDIDVVAAIGDSLTAGTGAVATSFYDILTLDNRGMSWVAGGQETWRQHLTLPNILKEFNANLTGFSLGDGRSHTRNSQFNVAVNGAMDQDLPYEAIELVRRMRKDRRVNFKKHWKLISVWVGTNDLCSDYCYDPTQGVAAHSRNLQATIDYLYHNVPRAFVMLVSSPYVPSYAKLRDLPNICLSTLPILCSCLFGGNEASKLRNVTLTTRLFQRAEQQLAESGRYDGREDFTVQFQPTFLDAQFPKYRNSRGRLTTDYSYLSVDCFHYSQKLHAVAANTIWNNLFEPPWNKTTSWKPAFEKFLCPTHERPYLVTHKNSKKWQIPNL
ncbi:hypothetical protein B566_EDAN013290 [Ephemera danica]|nr:hypothetical protein B566_EDAN013290 [Ephemera danica]